MDTHARYMTWGLRFFCATHKSGIKKTSRISAIRLVFFPYGKEEEKEGSEGDCINALREVIEMCSGMPDLSFF